MGRIYQRAGVWYLDWFDHNGQRRRESTNLRVGERGAKTKALRALQLREARRTEIRLGLRDPARESRSAPIADHVEAFERHLEARDITDAHRRETLKLVRDFLAARRVRRSEDLTLEAGEAWMGSLKKRGLSARSVNKARARVSQFGRWLARTRRIPANPFEALPTQNEEAARVLVRRGLELLELAALLESAPPLRALVYETAAVTGLRRGELAALRLEQLRGQAIELAAGETKNRRGGRALLPAGLAEQLEQLRDPEARARLEAGARLRLEVRRDRAGYLFPTVPAMRTFYRDLARAGIEQEDERGQRVDFHALRNTFGSLLELTGASRSAHQTQALMRHSDPKLTHRYVRPAMEAAAREAITDLAHHLAQARGKRLQP